jgi:hypothetical protein
MFLARPGNAGTDGTFLISLKTRTNAGMLPSVLPPTFANRNDGEASVEILRAESWATRRTDIESGYEAGGLRVSDN